MLPLFFFNPPATSEIYTLSLHDALPIFGADRASRQKSGRHDRHQPAKRNERSQDRKSTRLNSSHRCISYAVFCLKKKKQKIKQKTQMKKSKIYNKRCRTAATVGQ